MQLCYAISKGISTVACSAKAIDTPIVRTKNKLVGIANFIGYESIIRISELNGQLLLMHHYDMQVNFAYCNGNKEKN